VHADLLLVRHGQSEGNESGRFGGHGPTPLTKLGQRQAKGLVKLADEGPIHAIYASDLLRAQETATPLAERLGLPIQSLPGLRERSVGLMTGLTFPEAEVRFPTEYAAMMRRDPGARPPEGETQAECAARAVPVLESLAAQHPGQRIVVVSHAMTLSLLLYHVVGADLSHLPRLFFRTDNCAIHRLRYTLPNIWTIYATNDQRHLSGMEP